MATTDPIRNKSDLQALSDYFLVRGQLRNHTLIVLGACTALRIGDLLSLRWQDVYDAEHGRFRSHIAITEQKTSKTKTIALSDQAIDALRLYLPHSRGAYIFVNNRKDAKPITRAQAWRIIRKAVEELELDGNIACHSLRKTWGYHAWTSGTVSPVIITEIYQHSSYEITKRYLGVVQDDLDAAYRSVKLF